MCVQQPYQTLPLTLRFDCFLHNKEFNSLTEILFKTGSTEVNSNAAWSDVVIRYTTAKKFKSTFPCVLHLEYIDKCEVLCQNVKVN